MAIRGLLMACSLIGAGLAEGFVPSDGVRMVDQNTRAAHRSVDETKVKRAAATSTNNIETNNVAYDLRYYFGRKELGDDYRNYDLDNLIPRKGETRDDDFRFLLAKPVGDNLYFYVWTNDVERGDFTDGTITIADMTSQSSDGSVEFVEHSARFVNSMGVDSRFSKWSVDGICKSGDLFSFMVADCWLNYETDTGKTGHIRPSYKGRDNPRIGDSFTFDPNDTSDFSAAYFKDDYVRITDHEVDLMLTGYMEWANGYGASNHAEYAGYREDFYYFFTADRDISELVEIQYDYTYETYDVEYRVPSWHGSHLLSKREDSEYGTLCYQGLRDDPDQYVHQRMEVRKVDTVSTIYKPFNRVTSGTYTQTVDRWWGWWTSKDVSFRMNSIQDLQSLPEGDDYETFRTFIENVQEERTRQSKQRYRWCFLVKNDERHVTEAWNEDGWWVFNQNVYGTARCHEVYQAMVTWMHFRTDGEDFYVDVQDVPVDTSRVVMGYVPFRDFGDIFTDVAISVGKSIWQKILPLAFAVLGIILAIALFPMISAAASASGLAIRRKSEMADRKEGEKAARKEEKKAKKK